MKREIKFKGKDIKTGKWLYLDLLNKESFQDAFIKTIHAHSVEIQPTSVSQYTGLQDKKGNDIYEGDILEGKSYISRWVVVWKKGSFMLQSLGTTVDSFKELHFHADTLTVTGHIADDLHADDDPVKLTHLYTGAHTAF